MNPDPDNSPNHSNHGDQDRLDKSSHPATHTVDETTGALSLPKHLRLPKIVKVILVVGILAVIAFSTASIWYVQSLTAVNKTDTTKVRIDIPSGTTPQGIAKLLKENELIRNEASFRLYLRFSGQQDMLQAGVYGIAPSESVNAIVSQLTTGTTENFSITLFPGATLNDNTDTPSNRKLDVTSVLERSGYSEQEINTALLANYNNSRYSALFAGKPADSSLEGFIYGETYQFSAGASVSDIITRALDQFDAEVKQNKFEARFKEQGLTLFEGITLASIVQREVSDPADQPQVAQVFLDRLKNDMPLGSDVTYQYAARKDGVEPTPTLNSPYNTRIVRGLPPGPIAVPSLSALQAVADPASGSYAYFLSGDDDITYFSTTLEEHEKNIKDHCSIKCSVN